MRKNKKPPTEKDVIDCVRRGQLELPPLRFALTEPVSEQVNARPLDLLLDVTWQEQTGRFAVKCKAQSTPKAFDDAIRQLQDIRDPSGCRPMLVMPFLRETQLRQLEQLQMSGVDLCGNGVVILPGQCCVYRTGAKNRFPSSSPIKNIYRRNTSMVARVLLSRPSYDAVQTLRDEVNRRNRLVADWGQTPMSLGTVSKALKRLEDDLMIDRRQGVRLLQADRLLDRLAENCAPPAVTNRIRLKVACDWEQLPAFIMNKAQAASVPVVATGIGSVNRYAVMQRDAILPVYCPRADALLEQSFGVEDDRFPNLDIVETAEQPVYFDARNEAGFFWASPVQTYLELMTGDKRDRETADQVRRYILGRLEGIPE